ncbi:MAG TPA: GxGYxYP domain-containing protein, partial [Polyangia bacterium]|nr:GxGYxYP domain-containing protein [Polyangia bacterium]
MRTFVRASLLLATLSAAACGPSTTGGSGNGNHADLAVGVGGNGGDDLAVANDAAAPGDDLSTTTPAADMTVPPDLTAPSPTGLTWPPGQAFPTFPPIAALDVVDLGPLTSDQVTLFVTLAGLVNRTTPRIYTLNNGDGEGKTFWLDKMTYTKTMIANPYTLITKYQSEVKGIIVYDDTQMDTINLATTIAGQTNAIVASPAQATLLTAAPYSLALLVDLRNNKFTNKLDIYTYEYNLYSAGATHRLICGLNPAIAGNLRDYAVATQSMMVWLDPRVTAEATLLSQFLALLPATSPYLGWWADEPTGVSAASKAG